MKRAISLIVTMIFLLVLVGCADTKKNEVEATSQQVILITPQDIANLTESATFALPEVVKAAMRKISPALEEMNLDQLGDVLTAIELEKPSTDYLGSKSNLDLRRAVLIAATIQASEKFLETYRHQTISFAEGRTEIEEFFAPHPFLLVELFYRVKNATELLMKEAEWLEGEARVELEIQAERLYNLVVICETLLMVDATKSI